MPPVEQLDRSLYWPCSYGEYPGILERYVRDEPLLSLEDAVRRMTSFPAQRFGLHDAEYCARAWSRTSLCSTWTASATGRPTRSRTARRWSTCRTAIRKASTTS